MMPWWPGRQVCEVCLKEETLGGDTCLICGIPGEQTVVLRACPPAIHWLGGKLCGPCRDEFVARGCIDGLQLEAAS